MINRVVLVGRMTRDPELRRTPQGDAVTSFTLAVNRNFTSRDGQQQADFINCVVWRRQAENLARYCHKGSQIAVEGRIQSRNYTAQDGSKRDVTEVLVDNLTLLGSRSDNQNSAVAAPQDNFGGNNYPANNFASDNNYTTPVDVANVPTTDISEDPFKDFGEEITLSDDDLPF